MLNDPQQQFDPAANDQLARKNFNQNTVPELASRFAGSGWGGSSAFGNALSGAASDLETNLAAMRSHMGMQQQQMNNSRMMSLLGLGMQPQFDTAHYQGDQGLFGGMAQGLGQGLGMYGMSMFGGGNQQNNQNNQSDQLSRYRNYAQQLQNQQFKKSGSSGIAAMLSSMMKGAGTGAVGGPWGALLGGGIGAAQHMLGR
jgi:hypothetical protein